MRTFSIVPIGTFILKLLHGPPENKVNGTLGRTIYPITNQHLQV